MIAALVAGRLLDKPRRYRTDGDKQRISATIIANDSKNRALTVTLDTGDTALVNQLARMCVGHMLSVQGEIALQPGGSLLMRPRTVMCCQVDETAMFRTSSGARGYAGHANY